MRVKKGQEITKGQKPSEQPCLYNEWLKDKVKVWDLERRFGFRYMEEGKESF